jgi:anti-sigma factor RsiW
MKCEQVHDLLGAYCAEELDDHEMMEIRQHLAACKVCEREHREMALVMNALGSFEAIEPSADFRDRVWERIEESETRKRVFWLAAFAGLLARNRRLVVTGCIVFAVSLLTGVYSLQHMGGGPGVEMAEEGDFVSEGFVMREIPQQMEIPSDTVYTHFVTGDRPVHLTSQPQTYVYNPVVRPASGPKLTF